MEVRQRGPHLVHGLADGVVGSWDMVALHEFLREALARLKLAAAWVGPKIGHPRRWNSSTTPRVSGSSGPTTVRSG